MKPRFGSFVLFAAVLFTAASAFADKIPANFREGNQGPSPNLRIEFKAPAESSDFGKGREITLFGGDSRPEHHASLFDVGPRHGGGFEKEGKSWLGDKNKHKNKDHSGTSYAIPTPEPGSLTLLLFGAAVSGILALIVYRRL